MNPWPGVNTSSPKHWSRWCWTGSRTSGERGAGMGVVVCERQKPAISKQWAVGREERVHQKGHKGHKEKTKRGDSPQRQTEKTEGSARPTDREQRTLARCQAPAWVRTDPRHPPRHTCKSQALPKTWLWYEAGASGH